MPRCLDAYFPFPGILPPMAEPWDSEVSRLVSEVETTFGYAITLRSVVPGAMVAATGVRTETTATQSVQANRLGRRLEEVRTAAGTELVEVEVYEVRAASITLGDPAAGWRLDDATTGTTNMEIVRAERECERQMWVLFARESA